MDYKRVNNDINGNPRYVFHFLSFLNEGDNNNYNTAIEKSRAIGGKKYRGKDFGGGIVIQSFNIYDTIERIKQLQNKQL